MTTNKSKEEYEKFKLQWMMNHGYTLEDFVEKIAYVIDTQLTVEGNPYNWLFEAYEIFENEMCFDINNMYPSYSEWSKNNMTKFI